MNRFQTTLRTLLTAILLAAVISGCSSGVRTGSFGESRLQKQAQALETSGNYQGAAQLYLDAAAQASGTEQQALRLLAAASLRDHPGAGIVHDPRLTWNTIDVVEKAGGRPIMNKTGHAFMKERMRAEDAVYGGEMSAHHYFRQFAYCDSRMLPLLLLLQEKTFTARPLSEIVKDMHTAYTSIGEINRRQADQNSALALLQKK